LICPECKKDYFRHNNNEVQCLECGKVILTQNGKYNFEQYQVSKIEDSLDKIKYLLKKFGKLYSFLIWLISPVLATGHLNKFLKTYFQKINNEAIIINIGSGNSDISKFVSNLDIIPYNNVDIICDVTNLPFKNDSVDLIINMALLEHIPNQQDVINEIHRVLKPVDASGRGGVIYSYVPFIQGFHASPSDFYRLTIEGTKEIFKKFTLKEIRLGSGPTSGFLWILQEWLAIILSFGIKPLYYALLFLIMLVTFPLKFLDVLLIHHPKAKNIASGFIFIGEKR
jgi:SAM-dependent methyltransferase